MDRVVIITDVDTKLGYSILDAYNNAGETALGLECQLSSDEHGMRRNMYDIVKWNRSSAIDAKSVIIEIIRKHKTIDELILVQSLSASSAQLTDTEYSVLNKEIDYWIKGNFFIVREILGLFAEKKSGVLAIVNHAPADEKNPKGSLQESLQSALAGLTKSLLPLYAGKDVCINGFESSSSSHEELARFIYKSMFERFRIVSGKLLVFQSQKRIFGNLKK